MITGLILAEGDPEGLAGTLASLVPAVVEGLMGDAVVIAGRNDPAYGSIAEVAGASLTAVPDRGDPWRAGAALARRDWLLCLQAGDVPGDGWMRAVDRFLAAASRDDRPLGRFARRGPGGVLLNLVEQAAGTRMVRAGDVVQRNWLMANGVRRIRPARIAARIERVVVR